MTKNTFKKKLPFLLGLLGLLIGSTILFFPLLDTFRTGETITIMSYALINFTSYLFFTFTFVEILFAQMIRLDTDPFILISVSILTAMLSLTVDYFIGYFFSKTFLTKIIKEEKIKKHQNKLEKYGNSAIFIFNVLPLSSPLLTLAAGLIRYKYKNIILYSLLGLTIKYVGIAIFVVYYL